MKQYLSVALAVACVALVISLIVMKRGADEQHQKDTDEIAAGSNQLSSAQTQIASCNQTIAVFSNRLDAAQTALTASLTSSNTLANQLIEARSALDGGSEQITNLSRKVAQLESENQTLGGHIMDLTNQITGLTNQIALNRDGLDQANKSYALLENRFRRNVAERVLVERKFYNRSELTAQIEYLKWNPVWEISADRIYEGLDVVVRSNKAYVISPD